MSNSVDTHKPSEDKAIPAKEAEKPAMSADSAEKPGCPPEKNPALVAPPMEGKSWGDRFKGLSFGVIRDGIINYAVNAPLSAAIAYAFERNLGQWTENLVKKNFGTGSSASGVKYGIRAFFLTSGGTLLLLPIKNMDENRQEYQYKLSKMLDKTQKALGMANADTETNLKEYKEVEEIAHALRDGKEPPVSLEEVKKLEEKYHLTFKENGDIEFDKVKKSLLKLGLARAMAIGAAIGTNSILGMTTGTNPTDEQKAEGFYGDKGFGKFLTVGTPKVQKVLSYIPGFSKLGDKRLASNILLNDAVLTASSSVVFAAADPLIDRVLGGESHAEKQLAKEMDTNKDGWVSRQEAEAYIQKKFDLKDRNHDNQISTGEREGEQDVLPQKSKRLHPEKAVPSGYMDKVHKDRQEAQEKNPTLSA